MEGIIRNRYGLRPGPEAEGSMPPPGARPDRPGRRGWQASVDGIGASPTLSQKLANAVAGPDARLLVGVWLISRVLASLWAAVVSTVQPALAREAAIAVWPPSAPLGAWLERVLLAPWERWDAVYYLAIITRGYRTDDGTSSFHPLLSWLATPLARLTGEPLLALLVVSSLAGLCLLFAFHRLARLDLEPAAARSSTLLLLFSPLAFTFFAPYPEALFLLCAVLCLLWARQRRWWLAGLAGAAATLTRQQGIFLALPLAWELWAATGPALRARLAAWRSWAAVALVPAGYLAWLMYRAAALGDLHADGRSLQTLIYSILLSPSASRVVPVQGFYWPWQTLALALRKMVTAPEVSLTIDLAFAGGFLVLLALAWRGMRPSYRVYALAITLLSFSYYTGPFYPYMGLPRHLLLAFPVFIGLADRIREGWMSRLLTIAGTLGTYFLLLQYVLNYWVP